MPRLLANVKDGHDVIVFDGRHRPGLDLEASPRLGTGGQRRLHDLQSDESAELGVLGLEHYPHAADPEHAQHAVWPHTTDLAGPLRRGQKPDHLFGERLFGGCGSKRRLGGGSELEEPLHKPIYHGVPDERQIRVGVPRKREGVGSRKAMQHFGAARAAFEVIDEAGNLVRVGVGAAEELLVFLGGGAFRGGGHESSPKRGSRAAPPKTEGGRASIVARPEKGQ